LAAIASEKAGIIKKGVPVVIGETLSRNTSSLSKQSSGEVEGSYLFRRRKIASVIPMPEIADGMDYDTRYGEVHGELGGLYQQRIPIQY
jgi:dihydrofolate synthase/folylpolyglutamate synthase